MADMGGLLDFIKTPEGQGLLSGVMGYAANARQGTPLNNIGRGGMAGLMGYGDAQDKNILRTKEASQQKMLELQMGAAQRKADITNSYMKQLMNLGDASPTMQPGPAEGDAYMPAATVSQSAMTHTQPAPAGGNVSGGGSLTGLPRMAALADLSFNDGKELGKWQFDLAKPNWQNVNGNMVNTNAPGFSGGLQDGLQTSANGQTSLTRIVNGKPVISAPEGAVQTALAYKSGEQVPVDMPNGQKASFTPQEWSDYTGKGIIPLRYGGSPSIPNKSAWNPSPQDMAKIQADIQATGNTDPSIASNSHATFSQSSPDKVFGLTMSNGEKDANEQQQARSLATINTGAKAGADRIMSGYDGARSAVDTLTSTAEARKSIAGGSFIGTGAETKLSISKALNGMGFDIAPDKVSNTDYLQSTLGQGILNKAKTLGANPTDNDARIIRSIVGSIGTDPNALGKLLDYQDVIANRAIDLHNKNYTEAKGRGFDAGFDLTVNKPKSSSIAPMDTMPKANSSNKDRTIRDTETGRLLKSNGLTWVEVK